MPKFAAMATRPQIVDYAPVRQNTGAVGRMVKSFAVFAVLMALEGWHVWDSIVASNEAQSATATYDPTVNHDPTVALFWFAGAAIFGGIALLVGYGRWLRTGRF